MIQERAPLRKSDIVSILVPFTDLSDCKVRPAVILAVSAADIIVACITSRISDSYQPGDSGPIYIPIVPTTENGLRSPSYVQLSKIITLDKYLISCRIGRIEEEILHQINSNLYDFLRV